MLAANRMDLLAVNERNAHREFIKPEIRSAVIKVTPPFAVQAGYIAFPIGAQHADTLSRFNSAFKGLIRSGQFFAMAAKYGDLVKIPSSKAKSSKLPE
jgi:hypothetical protein